MPIPLRRVVQVGGALAAVGLLAWMLRAPAQPVDLAAVTRGTLEVVLEEEGKTRVHPRHLVASPVAGRLEPLTLDPGDAVAAGAVVARLWPLPLDARSREQAAARIDAARANQREAEARIAEALAAHQRALSSLARQRELAAAGQLSTDELERAGTEEASRRQGLEAARQRASAARFELAAARSALLDAESGAVVEVRAPAGGVVLRLHEESERVVGAGAPILEIGALANLEVAVEVLTGDAVAVREGAAMTVDLGDGVWRPARVDRIEPAAFTKISPLGVEEQRVLVLGRLLEPPPSLGDRFRLRARIVLWRGEDLLLAPSGAVFRQAEGWGTYVVEGGRARLRTLEVGHRGRDAVEVLAGVTGGEQVILYPGAGIGDGVRVTPR
jgi:HlyD family secretion protein